MTQTITLIEVGGQPVSTELEVITNCQYCNTPILTGNSQEILDGITVHVGEIDPELQQGDHSLGLDGLDNLEVAYGYGCALDLMRRRADWQQTVAELSRNQIDKALELFDAYYRSDPRQRGRFTEWMQAALGATPDPCTSCVDSGGQHGSCGA